MEVNNQFHTLKQNIRGTVLTPEHVEYDLARKVFNGAIDKYPSVIVQCLGVADVIQSIEYAREHDLLIAIHGSGHNVAGTAMCDGGLVVDLRMMKSIRVDPVARVARAEPGVTWGEFDRETQVHSLATTGGTVTSTGIAGLTLGGGFGWLHGKHGLTCDNLISADVVTADGELLIANESNHPELFWAIRGGGGNFGIVTSFEFRLHPIKTVLAGTRVYPLSKAWDVLKCYRALSQAAPDELTTFASFFSLPSGPVVSIDLCYCGIDLSIGTRLLSSLHTLGEPLVDNIRCMSYLELQNMFDNPFRRGQHSYWKATYLKALEDDAIDTLIEHFRFVPSQQTIVFIEHFHGAMCSVGDGETAFSHRGAQYSVLIASNWLDSKGIEANRNWTQDFFYALGHFSTDRVYVNYLGTEAHERIIQAYGPEKYEKLARIKNTYDPTNFFRVNQNIAPYTET